jgi:ATP-dependent Lon protease
VATQDPARRKLNSFDPRDDQASAPPKSPTANYVSSSEATAVITGGEHPATIQEPSQYVPKEKHFSILYGDTGYSYESILSPYICNAKTVVIEDPYIRQPHQISNFVRFCETLVKAGTIRRITLITSHDDKTQLAEMAEKLEELKQSLLEIDIELEVRLNPNIHDREIRFDNGWIIKIGRGLDFYQKPSSWFEVGAHDLNLRKCLETKVDIFRVEDR